MEYSEMLRQLLPYYNSFPVEFAKSKSIVIHNVYVYEPYNVLEVRKFRDLLMNAK